MAVPFWLLGGTIPAPSLWWQPVSCRRALLRRTSLHAARVDHRRRVGRHACARVEDSARRAAERRADRRSDRRAALDGGGIEQHRHRAAESSILGIHTGASARRSCSPRYGAAAYACFDVLVQKWSPVWGTGRFLPIAMACGAAYSLALRRFDVRGAHPRRSRPCIAPLHSLARGRRHVFRDAGPDVHVRRLHLQASRPARMCSTARADSGASSACGRSATGSPIASNTSANARARVAIHRGDSADGGDCDGAAELPLTRLVERGRCPKTRRSISSPKMPPARREICLPFPTVLLELCQEHWIKDAARRQMERVRT